MAKMIQESEMPKFTPSRSGRRLVRSRAFVRAVLAASAALVAISSALVVGSTPVRAQIGDSVLAGRCRQLLVARGGNTSIAVPVVLAL
jgi:hypothetical protein